MPDGGEKGEGPTPAAPVRVRRGLRARLFAGTLARAGDAQRRLYGDRKRRLLAGLSGTVVEVGTGAGPNAAYLPAGTRWIAVEPNVHFHPRLRAAAAAHGLDLDLRPGVAEALPVADGAADAVVCTLVLCSVDDVRQSLAEARRVLRPGGRFVFVEHVAAPRGTALRLAQRVVRAPWGWFGDGCRPDRETGRRIREAGFSHVELETFRVPLGLASPHVMGVAVV